MVAMSTTPTEATVTFSTELTIATSEALLADVEGHAEHGVEHIQLAMSTRGGEVASAMMLFEELIASPIKLVTYATGEVASSGILPFLAGDRRCASPDATFLMHPFKIKANPEWPTAVEWLDIQDLHTLERSSRDQQVLRELDLGVLRLARQEREVRAVVEQCTKLTGSEITKLVQLTEPVDATYALAVGIVHEIAAL